MDEVICPKCKKAIDHLVAFCYEQNRYVVDVVKDSLQWSASEAVEGSATKTDFNCPECDETLFTDRDGGSNPQVVFDFLKGVTMTWVQDVGKRAMVLGTFNKRENRPEGSYYAEGYPREGGDIGIYFVDPSGLKRGMK